MDISPDKQNIDRVFSNTAYFIDFYQRDYRWTDEPVLRLLDDVFFKFTEQYARTSDRDPSQETITAHYPWYYLNTYVTNVVGGRTYIVDGQQRLTTLSLILIKLRHLARQHQSDLERWIEDKICGRQGFERNFWMNHIGHKITQQGLFEGNEAKDIAVTSGITAENMVRNYQTISAFIDKKLADRHSAETFTFYFLYRLVLINLAVEQTDVSMVFEVINDRGVKLRPHEILKGKLLGQIDKIELDKDNYNKLWEESIQAVNSYRDDEIDSFFRYWLKAKYADSRKAGQRFDSDYHREIFKIDLNAVLKLDHNAAEVKTFLKGPFRYYTSLYCRIWAATREETDEFPAVFNNRLNEQDNQFLLILSSCRVDDPEETAKIRVVSSGLDRLFSLLQLQGAYDSNEYTTRLFEISSEIRGKSAAEIPAVFEKHLIEELMKRRGIPDLEAFTYPLFKPMSIDRLNTRFTRYFFARVEMLLAEKANQKMRHSLEKLVSSRGAVNGFHIEHIIARNDDNLAIFGNDQDRFEQERNRLGATLLLRGQDNISSGNEPYSVKLTSYSGTLLWNETLREDSYKSKLDFTRFVQRYDLPFRPLEKFGPEEIEERQKLLFALSGLIWPEPTAQKSQMP